jgi:hypothetical protein
MGSAAELQADKARTAAAAIAADETARFLNRDGNIDTNFILSSILIMLDKTNRFLFGLRGYYTLLIIFATGQFERTKMLTQEFRNKPCQQSRSLMSAPGAPAIPWNLSPNYGEHVIHNPQILVIYVLFSL